MTRMFKLRFSRWLVEWTTSQKWWLTRRVNWTDNIKKNIYIFRQHPRNLFNRTNRVRLSASTNHLRFQNMITAKQSIVKIQHACLFETPYVIVMSVYLALGITLHPGDFYCLVLLEIITIKSLYSFIFILFHELKFLLRGIIIIFIWIT